MNVSVLLPGERVNITLILNPPSVTWSVCQTHQRIINTACFLFSNDNVNKHNDVITTVCNIISLSYTEIKSMIIIVGGNDFY